MTEIKFLVNGTSYKILLDKILNFPIKTAFINRLVDNYLHKRCGVKIINESIVINPDYHNFDKIVAIYNNPTDPLTKILGYDKILETPSLFNEIKQCVKTHPFIEESQYQHFMEELRFYGIEDLYRTQIDQNILVPKIDQRLRAIFKDKYDIFVNGVKTIGGYLSGSFILQTILGEVWEGSDINIYVNKYIVEGLALKSDKKSRLVRSISGLWKCS